MSAICGIFNLNGKPVETVMLQQMVASSPYRGNDGVGYWQDRNIGLAHIAFHVTPESVGENQPLKSADGKLVLVADVRLDNREELIRALPDAPDNPTDPDLLLASYLRWEDACTEHLLGDFAFALWNSKKQELFLARDHLGAYGFYWHRQGNQFLFASELAALLNLSANNPEINETAVTKSLLGLPLEFNETHFQSFFLCPPAHCIVVSKQKIKKWRYWDIDPDYRIIYTDEEEYTDHFLAILKDSVACRMRSIGPVGISVSGGCDSTLVAAVASKLLSEGDLPQRKLKSFSYVFDQFKECDERLWIQPVVDQYHIDATYIPTDNKLCFSKIGRQTVFHDIFSYDWFFQLHATMLQEANQNGCKTLLTGFYGDTEFESPSFFVADALSERKFHELYHWLLRYFHDIDWRRHVVRYGLRPLIPRSLKNTYRKFWPQQLNSRNPGVAKERVAQLQKVMHNHTLSPAAKRLTSGRQLRYQSLFSSAWSNGLPGGRGKFGNRYGVETISPYFDRRLVEYVLAIPPDQISRPGQYRYLQKNAMRRLLPEVVYNRQQKTSFSPLLHAGLRRNWGIVFDLLQEKPRIVSNGWVNEDWLMKQLSAKEKGRNTFQIAIFVHLELWLQAVENTRLKRDK